jgi:hypothetical protein
MTYAPTRLLELRRYLRQQTGLSDNALGIVGDENHDGGYHHGWDDRRIRNGQTSDYSWTESTRDSSHRTNAAAAIDIGMFDRLLELNRWLVGQCEAGAQDCTDIRSIIYTDNGTTVKRWDRLRRRTTGDSSHLYHTHVSYFRDAEDRDKTKPFRRFFEGGIMADIGVDVEYMSWRIEALSLGFDTMRGGPEKGVDNWAVQTLKAIQSKLTDLTIPAPAPVDPAAIRDVLLDPEVLAALAKAVNDDHYARMRSSE